VDQESDTQEMEQNLPAMRFLSGAIDVPESAEIGRADSAGREGKLGGEEGVLVRLLAR
jgi:hypothetical protein